MRSAHLILAFSAVLLVAGGARLVWIEREHGADLRQQAVQQQTATITIPAQRGNILDTRGRILAGSVRRPSIFMDPAIIADPQFAAYSIAPVLDLSADALLEEITTKRDRRFVWLKREITDAELDDFQHVRRERRLHGFAVRREPQRVYPYETLAAHVLGFVGAPPPEVVADAAGHVPEQYGWAGIERAWNEALTGRPGQRSVTVDVRRRTLRSPDATYTPPRDGHNVILTLDVHIQQVTERHLATAVSEHSAQWGVAVVLDPHSGEVLAMASEPSFDPAAPMPNVEPDTPAHKTAEQHLRNRAIADAYEPGSIFKPFIMAPALADDLLTLDEVFPINGPTHAFGRRVIHDVHAYPRLTGGEIIAKSSNIGMGFVGDRAGNERLYEYVRAFGFGHETGVGLPGEHAGLVNRFENWTGYSTQSIPIGQEIAVTPLQIVSAFSVFCNDGILYQPRVVRGLIDAQGQVVSDHSRPLPLRRVLAPEIAEKFRREALAAVVTPSGSGRHAVLPDYQLFGKTGTAQIARLGGGGYIPNAYTGSFVGGGPVSDPRIVVLVSLYQPKGQYYGGVVAAPAASRIIADTLAYLQVPPEPPAPDPAGMPAGTRH